MLVYQRVLYSTLITGVEITSWKKIDSCSKGENHHSTWDLGIDWIDEKTRAPRHFGFVRSRETLIYLIYDTTCSYHQLPVSIRFAWMFIIYPYHSILLSVAERRISHLSHGELWECHGMPPVSRVTWYADVHKLCIVHSWVVNNHMFHTSIHPRWMRACNMLHKTSVLSLCWLVMHP